MAYKLANAGYPVIICSSANFYFDLAYSWDPDERGHSWSGVVDLYQSWKAVPGKLYLSHDQTIDGKPWNWSEQAQKFTKLTDQGRQNIIGVSGQVWTETIKGGEMLEYYLFPKMFGYVERAWHGDPDWSMEATEAEMKSKRSKEWNQFVNLVGQRELPRLQTIFGGVDYRLPRPGVQVINEQVMVNSAFPGMLIRYTDSGEEPTVDSPIYREPIYIRPGYTPRFKLFMPSGKSGLSSGIH
jgi:hexosaminidase